VVSERSDEQWLSIREVQAILRLPAKMCRTWVRQKVPAEAIKREGRHVYVGYQYCPGRRAINADCRDAKGRFVSHRTDGHPPKRKGFIHPARRRYLSDAD